MSALAPIPLSQPDISNLEEVLVLETLRSGRLSIGPMVEKFESLVARRVGCRFGIAINSGTSGLHLLMAALGIGPGDEVITTPYSFIASSNCILMVGARPVFVDIDPVSFNMDPAQLEAAITPRTKAIIAVSTFGNPAHMDVYERIADHHGIPLIEDSCEALGATLNGRASGSFGTAGVFGFYPNKQITTGEGGMIVTDDSGIAELCRSMRNQGRPIPRPGAAHVHTHSAGGQHMGSWLAHERLGFNFRLSELNAALGVGQMERLDHILAARDTVANQYLSRLSGNSFATPIQVPQNARMSWFVFALRLADRFNQTDRDAIIADLREQGIGAADYFPCIHLQPFYRNLLNITADQFPQAEALSQRSMAIPFHNRMTSSEIDRVVTTLERAVAKRQSNSQNTAQNTAQRQRVAA